MTNAEQMRKWYSGSSVATLSQTIDGKTTIQNFMRGIAAVEKVARYQEEIDELTKMRKEARNDQKI